MHSIKPEDSQEISRIAERDRELHQIRARRQKTGHDAYAAIAGGLGGLTLLVWGTILREAVVAPPAEPTRGYLAFLAAAIVLGVSAAAATASWMSTRVNQRLNAEGDRLREYDNERLVKNLARQIIATAEEKRFSKIVADEVTRQLDVRDREAKRQAWERMLDPGNNQPGPIPHHPGPDVVPFRRPNGGDRRNSG